MFNILIVKFGALGDVVRTSYVLPGLYTKYGSPRIYWLTSSHSFDLLRFNPYVYSIATPELNIDTLRDMTFDLVISLDDETEVLNIVDTLNGKEVTGAFLSHGKPAYSENAAEWFDMGLISRFGKAKADELKKINVREHNQIFASMLDIEIAGPIFYNSSLTEQNKTSLFSGEFFNVGVNSGAGSRWLSKELLLYETVKLIERLLLLEVGGRKTAVYLLGGLEETERNAVIRDAIKSDRLFDTGNDNSILEFAAIIKGCDYVITSDSLALHLAISQKVKNLSFFSPTSAAEIGTFGTGSKVISLSDDYCSYRRDAGNSSITADRILDAFLKHLKNTQ
ncbi:MAG: glycosyltransferase family 9 protein [Nitrospirae bacterium]|nr:glycosyltransferase family 9 protein [Nitrospirota bacterium]